MDDQTVLASGRPEASLVVRQGAQVGTTFSLTSDALTLGRDEESDVPIRDPEVSRRHARISWQAGKYHIEDLGSTNGTFLNGAPVTSPQPLQSGDTIGLGQTLLVFQTQAAVMPAQPTAVPARPSPPPSPPSAEPAEPESGRSRCLLWGCGCLILLGVLLVVLAGLATLFFADAIQPLFDDLGIPIQLTMRYMAHLLT